MPAELNPVWKEKCIEKVEGCELCEDLQEFMVYVMAYLQEQLTNAIESQSKNSTMADLIDALKDIPTDLGECIAWITKAIDYYVELATFYAQPVIDYGLLIIDITTFSTTIAALIVDKISTLSCTFPPLPPI